jgi:hypothetical protein
VNNQVPSEYSLMQNYPNPFNPSTAIQYSVAKAGNVKLIIYDISGREVGTLVDEYTMPGTYEAKWDASGMSSGIYFYKIVTEGFVNTKKMILLK